MTLILQIATGVALGQGIWLLAARLLRLPKWIRPTLSFGCQIDRVGVTEYKVKIGIEGFGK
jgi:hypothetical protein